MLEMARNDVSNLHKNKKQIVGTTNSRRAQKLTSSTKLSALKMCGGGQRKSHEKTLRFSLEHENEIGKLRDFFLAPLVALRLASDRIIFLRRIFFSFCWRWKCEKEKNKKLRREKEEEKSSNILERFLELLKVDVKRSVHITRSRQIGFLGAHSVVPT